MDAIKHIELKESQAQALLTHLYAEQDRLISQVKEIESKISDNETLIDQLEGKSTNGVSNQINADAVNDIANSNGSEGYDIGWSISKKIDFIIRESDKFLLAAEIVDGIVEKEPEKYISEDLRRKLSVNVYAALNGKFSNGSLTRKESAKGYRYQFK